VLYRLKTTDGVWTLETYRQATDSMSRRVLHQEAIHFKAEQKNPLDFLKGGDRVLFRVEDHRKIGGVDHEIYIPFATDPNKEAKFIGEFQPDHVTPSSPFASDNVRAMCEAHKLSAELEKQFCTERVSNPTAITEPLVAMPPSAPPGNAPVIYPSGVESYIDPRSLTSIEKVQRMSALIRNKEASYCSAQTTPAGAQITIDGEVVGVTPFAFVLIRHSDIPRTIIFSMPGHQSVIEKKVPDGLPIVLMENLSKE
jgi:hypothetical protein